GVKRHGGVSNRPPRPRHPAVDSPNGAEASTSRVARSRVRRTEPNRMSEAPAAPPPVNHPADYTPPQVWAWNKANGGAFANINRPIAGPTHDKELPVGRHPLQLYSQGTPNGGKGDGMLGACV